MTTPLEIFAANRDLALAEAEVCSESGWSLQANFAQGQAQAYGEAIRILSRPVRVNVPPELVEQFRCTFRLAGNFIPCGDPASFVTPDGRRRCDLHAPADATLTISEHDDQRETK